MQIISVFVFLTCLCSGVCCSSIARLKARVDLMESKQFHDSKEFREDINILFDKVNNTSRDPVAKHHVNDGKLKLVTNNVTELEATVKAVKRSITEEKQHVRNVFRDVTAILQQQNEEHSKELKLIRNELQDNFEKIYTSDLQVNSRLDNIVSVLEKLVKLQEQIQIVNENILEKIDKLNDTFDSFLQSLSNRSEQIGLAKQENSCGTWKKLYSSCYVIGTDGSSFNEASAKCEIFDAHLAEIDTEEENTFLIGLAGKETEGIADAGAWVGGTDVQKDGFWIWYKSKKPVSFTAWKVNEPNGGTSENCLHLYRDHNWRWNDARCTMKMSYVCEKEL